MFKWKKMTKDFEGFREKVYPDPIHGWDVPTVGYGFNVHAGGVPEDVASGKRPMRLDEAEPLFEKKYQEAENRAVAFAGPLYDSMPIHRQAILNDMAYNLGDRLFNFKDMRAAIHEQRFGDVPAEMKDSKWYKQVGRRSKALIKLWNERDTVEADGGKDYGYGLRTDKTQKGRGYFGELKRPDGKISTELAIGVTFDGKEMEIPSLVPTLDKAEIDYLLDGNKPTAGIVQKAVAHAKTRMASGKNPFAGPDDEGLIPAPAAGPKLSRFGAAFKAAREQGKTEFMFDGKPIAVR